VVKSRTASALIFSVVLALAAGCGSSSSTSTATTVAAPKGSTIVIGSVATLSGPVSSANQPTADTAKAWQDWVNASGGINDHPVKVVMDDDTGDPATALTVVKKLVESDHAIVIAGGNFEATMTAWADYVTGAGVPVVGGTGSGSLWTKNPDFYNVGTTILGQLSGVVTAGKDGGATKMSAGYCAEVAVCSQVIPLLKSTAEKAGLGFDDGLAVSGSAADYISQCLAWKGNGDDFVFLGLASATIQHVVQSCTSQGYSPTWGIVGSAVDTALLQTGGKFLGVAPTFPWFVDDAAVKNYKDAMAKYAKGKNTDSLASTQSWAALEVVRAALEATVKPGADATSADVVTGLTGFKGTLDGLLPQELPITAGQPEGQVLCFFTVAIGDNKVTAPNGLKPTCATT
jgi:branched-chain amino acid transport system substrate-binding protein